MSREETVGSIEMAFGVWGAVGPSNHVLDGGSGSTHGEGQFWGDFFPIEKQWDCVLPCAQRHVSLNHERHLDRSSRFCRVPRRAIPDRPTDHGNVVVIAVYSLHWLQSLRNRDLYVQLRDVSYNKIRPNCG